MSTTPNQFNHVHLFWWCLQWPFRRDPAAAAHAAVHHVANDRADSVRQALRCGAYRFAAAGDAVGR